MKLIAKLLPFLSIVLLFGCSDREDKSTEPQKTVIDHQIKALEKAKGVEQQLFDSAAKQKDEIDAYE